MENRVSGYKKCRKKKYEVYACIPRMGTLIINKLKEPQAYLALRSKGYLLPEDRSRILSGGAGEYLKNQLLSMINAGVAQEVTKEHPVVVCGTIGELWVSTLESFNCMYEPVSSGDALDISGLKGKLNETSLDSGTLCLTKAIMPWKKFRVKELDVHTPPLMARFIPVNECGSIKQDATREVLKVNWGGLNHGKGDFLVCYVDGLNQPMYNKNWVVNGLVFRNTYDNHGFSDVLASEEECKKEWKGIQEYKELLSPFRSPTNNSWFDFLSGALIHNNQKYPVMLASKPLIAPNFVPTLIGHSGVEKESKGRDRVTHIKVKVGRGDRLAVIRFGIKGNTIAYTVTSDMPKLQMMGKAESLPDTPTICRSGENAFVEGIVAINLDTWVLRDLHNVLRRLSNLWKRILDPTIVSVFCNRQDSSDIRPWLWRKGFAYALAKTINITDDYWSYDLNGKTIELRYTYYPEEGEAFYFVTTKDGTRTSFPINAIDASQATIKALDKFFPVDIM